MKYIKRTLALLLAVVLVLALSISAFAVDTNGSIKVDNAVVNKTYTLYRIFDLDSHGKTAQMPLTLPQLRLRTLQQMVLLTMASRRPQAALSNLQTCRLATIWFSPIWARCARWIPPCRT